MNPCPTHLKSRIHFRPIHSVLSPSCVMLAWVSPLAVFLHMKQGKTTRVSVYHKHKQTKRWLAMKRFLTSGLLGLGAVTSRRKENRRRDEMIRCHRLALAILAVLFLLFDVEVVFLWPWAQVFHQAATSGASIPLEGGAVAGKGFLLVGMGIFFSLLVFGLVYEWKKGAFRWD